MQHDSLDPGHLAEQCEVEIENMPKAEITYRLNEPLKNKKKVFHIIMHDTISANALTILP